MKFEKLNFWLLSSGILSVALLRVAMAPLPNIEPIMLFTIATALALGPLSGFIFGAGAMFLSDFFMGMPGPWTLYTSLVYGLVALIVGSLSIFKKSWNRKELFAVTFLMTVFWDIVTATFFAFEFFMPLSSVMIAQIPFTILHLSNCAIAFLFAPYLLRFFSIAKDFSVLKFLRQARIYL